jgi:hypothetical protein
MHSIFVSYIGVVIAGYGFYYSSMIIGRYTGDDYLIQEPLTYFYARACTHQKKFHKTQQWRASSELLGDPAKFLS